MYIFQSATLSNPASTFFGGNKTYNTKVTVSVNVQPPQTWQVKKGKKVLLKKLCYSFIQLKLPDWPCLESNQRDICHGMHIFPLWSHCKLLYYWEEWSIVYWKSAFNKSKSCFYYHNLFPLILYCCLQPHFGQMCHLQLVGWLMAFELGTDPLHENISTSFQLHYQIFEFYLSHFCTSVSIF